MAEETFESDLDFAFRLQLQEALAASLEPTTLSHPDRDRSRIAALREREDLDRRIHDQCFAAEIAAVSDDEWADSGDYFERPFGEGSSSASAAASSSAPRTSDSSAVFGLYFKGLVSDGEEENKKKLAGIGIAICDPRDNLIFEVRKPLFGNGLSRQAAEAKALIEGLEAALALDLNSIIVFFDNFPLYKFISGKWSSKQRKVAELVNQAMILQKKFSLCNSRLLARNEIKFAFKLARDAIEFQMNRSAESSCRKNLSETCVICLEDNDVSQIFSVNGCLHRYCFSCMKQHVEYKLRNAQAPKCPHQGCKSELDTASCEKFLTPKFMEIMLQREKEATTPVAERVYCPNPRCSVLMSRTEASEHSKKDRLDVDRSGARKCVKCNNLFCVNCKVPWHRNMTCNNYKRLNPNPPAEDTKLKLLASRNLWRQCKKCNLMIELSEGCYHMTCRCGFEFCYNCGAEWREKKATCSCPLWDENHIWHNEDRDFDDEEEEDDYDDEDEDQDEYDSYDSDSEFTRHLVLS